VDIELVAIDLARVNVYCHKFVDIELVAIEIIPDYPLDYPFPFKSLN